MFIPDTSNIWQMNPQHPSLPCVVRNKRGVFQAPGAEAHGVVDDLDRGEVRFLPPEPYGR